MTTSLKLDLFEVGNFFLHLEEGDGECQQEHIHVRLDTTALNGAEDGDVLGQSGVPQILQYEGYDEQVQKENEDIVHKVLSRTGRKDTLHF